MLITGETLWKEQGEGWSIALIDWGHEVTLSLYLEAGGPFNVHYQATPDGLQAQLTLGMLNALLRHRDETEKAFEAARKRQENILGR